MRDVAAHAGVSTTTVSLVLRGKAPDSIPEATQQRVRGAAMELGYRANAMASGLRRGTSDTIGLVSDLIASTPFAGAMIQGAQDAAWEAGHLLLVVNTGGDTALEQMAIDAMLDRRVEALVYATMYHRVVDIPPHLAEVPAVLLDARSSEHWLPSVAPDEAGGARAAVEHLIEAGHRRIGFVQCGDDVPATAERFAGYRDCLERAGLPFDPLLVEVGTPDTSGGQLATAELLGRPDRPTALFCFNDRMAMGAYRAARKAGVSIPDELSVVGFDNMDLIAPWLDPPLTTIQLPHYEMGRWAVEHVLGVLARGPADVRHHRMPCPLVERESVAPPLADPLVADDASRTREG